jgi:hypothetical protein
MEFAVENGELLKGGEKMIPTRKGFALIGVFLCSFWLFIPGSHAAIYYVDAAGGKDSNPGTLESPWQTISKANPTLQAGDTVYLRGGTYYISGNGIAPSNNGSSYSSRIIYSGHENETVTLIGASASAQGIYLSGKQFIKVSKINFRNFTHHLLLTNASQYNEISNCTFAYQYSNASADWIGSRIRSGSMYNHVHHCIFRDYGWQDGDDHCAVFGIGIESSTSDGTRYNLVEFNNFYHGGHHVVEVNGTQNVFRFNYIHNEPWALYNGTYYGNRIMFFAGNMPDVGRNLIHGNRIAYGGETSEPDQCGGSGGTLTSPYNILRRNMYYKCLLYGIFITTYMGSSGPNSQGVNNYIYNNTFWNNGITSTCQAKPPWDGSLTHAVDINEDATYTRDNVIKNNLFWANVNQRNATRPVVVTNTSNLPVYNTVSNNFNQTSDPKFVYNAGTPNSAIELQFDFRLQANSPAIDAAGFLTTITSTSGSGISFTVADAGYFFDGWGMSVIGSASVLGDTIQLQGQTAKVRIIKVDYSTNTITLDTALTWTQGQGIALSYEGAAPDMGAHEFGQEEGPASPKNLRIVN